MAYILYYLKVRCPAICLYEVHTKNALLSVVIGDAGAWTLEAYGKGAKYPHGSVFAQVGRTHIGFTYGLPSQHTVCPALAFSVGKVKPCYSTFPECQT